MEYPPSFPEPFFKAVAAGGVGAVAVCVVQLLDKAADVPVVVPTVRLRCLLSGFVELIIDYDGVTV